MELYINKNLSNRELFDLMNKLKEEHELKKKIIVQNIEELEKIEKKYTTVINLLKNRNQI